jgi:hypothetical protein
MSVRTLLVALLAVVAASCGDDAATTTAPASTTTAAPTTAMTAAIETTTSVAEQAGSTDNAVAWATDRVSLEADDFRIMADGAEFLGSGGAELHSDPGDPDYTTLEVEWQENGVEMRLYMYFEAVGAVWHCYEMRTYDGQPGGHWDWIYYTGPFFESPLGEAFTGSVTLESDSDNEDNEYSGQVQFVNLRLLPTFQEG